MLKAFLNLNLFKFLLIGIGISAYSQAQTLIVVGGPEELPVENVSIFNQDTSKAVTTDAKGLCKLDEFGLYEALTIQHPRFTVRYSNKAELAAMAYRLSLTESYQLLNEVVVASRARVEIPKNPSQSVVKRSVEPLAPVGVGNTADLIAQSPAVYLQKSQAGGGSPNLRGFEANRVLLIVDGVRMNNAIFRSGHLQNILDVDAFSLGKTEVFLGPSSLLYGSDAMGGVIHLQTKEFLPGPIKEQYSFAVQAESARELLITHAEAAIQREKWSSFSSFTFRSSGDLHMGKNRFHGYDDWGKVKIYRDPKSPFDTTAYLNDNPSVQPGIGYQQSSFVQKFQFQQDQRLYTLNFQYSQTSNIDRFDRLNDISNGKPKFAEWYYGPQSRLMLSFSQLSSKPRAWADIAKQHISYQQFQESRHTRRFAADARENREERVDMVEYNISLSKSLKKNWQINYGFNSWFNLVNSQGYLSYPSAKNPEPAPSSEMIDSRYPNGNSNYYSFASYASAEKSFINGAVLHAGLRFNQQSSKARYLFAPIELTNNPIYSQFKAITAATGLRVPHGGKTHSNLSVSSGFHAPNVDDMFKIFEKNDLVTVPNPNLEPEYSITAEYNLEAKDLYSKLDLQLNFHYTHLFQSIVSLPYTANGRDTIEYDGEWFPVYANQNAGSARVYGSELMLDYELVKSTYLNFSIAKVYGFLNTDSLSPLSHIPPLFGQLGFRYERGKYEARLFSRFNGPKPTELYGPGSTDNLVEATPEGNPAWYTINLEMKANFNSGWRVQLGVSNLLDAHYKTFASGISAPGRSLNIGLQKRF